jgi:hypothetical protein
VVELLQQENNTLEQTEDLVSVMGTDNAEREATGSLPAGQLDINKHSLQHEHRYISPSTHRSPSTSGMSNLEPACRPTMGKPGDKRECQNAQTDISTEVQHSVDNGDSCDTADEGPQGTKRRKLQSAPVVAAPSRPQQPEARTSLSTTDFEASLVMAQASHRHLLADIHNEEDNALQTSQSSPMEPVLLAEYNEWPFQGFLKRTTIGHKKTYNLEFTLPPISETVGQLADFEASNICCSRETISNSSNSHEAATHPQIQHVPVEDHDKWVVRKIIDSQVLDSERYYCVDWAPTWTLASELGGAQEAINQYLGVSKHRHGRSGMVGGGVKKRGRPRKQK